MGHAHIGIIDNRRDGIKHLPVLPDQHRVGHAGRINRQIAQDAVGPLDPLLFQLEAPDALPALGAQPVLFLLAQLQRGAVIDRGLPHVELFLALEVQFRGRLERLVEPVLGAQLIGGGGVAVQPLRLTFQPVPGQAEPLQGALDPVRESPGRAFRVGIVEPQDECAARLARNQVVEQRRAQVSDMQAAGGGRGETGDGHGADILISRGDPVSQSRAIVQFRADLAAF